ncbi:hypothetical protein [Enterocloster lavalensis]|uniref:hypothetical protein n=1 Tax=Enterocloster lavalensis TaxID=460384 RepID=UPI0023F159C0|nr:hypothetical protein [Enterocloster lavalensis]
MQGNLKKRIGDEFRGEYLNSNKMPVTGTEVFLSHLRAPSSKKWDLQKTGDISYPGSQNESFKIVGN